MTAYSQLKTIVQKSRDSFGDRQTARVFLSKEWGGIVASRMLREAGRPVIPWQHALTGDEAAQQVIDYIDDHEQRKNGLVISRHI